jgi:hypothetical protein
MKIEHGKKLKKQIIFSNGINTHKLKYFLKNISKNIIYT